MSINKRKTEYITIRIELYLKKKLENLAEKESRSVAGQVRHLIREASRG